MLNKLRKSLKDLEIQGNKLICAVSGGADSMALLFGVYLLKEELSVQVEAAHFNHGLRGTESDGDEAFVREFCAGYGIPCHVGRGQVVSGKKGLEAAAREARYSFFHSLDGKIATAHTADDNAETVLMHLVRGTGLKGLGGIAPVNGKVIRPMLSVTRQEVLEFLEEYAVAYRTDSSNEGDDFLRNRLRHGVMPLLKAENPSLAENVSAMALRLREDEEVLSELAYYDGLPPVTQLQQLERPVRRRMLERFLKESGVREPEAAHILRAEQLVFSGKPSASAQFPGGITLARNYDRLEVVREAQPLETVELPQEGIVDLPELGLQVICGPAETQENSENVFTVAASGKVFLRCRQEGDEIRLPGGTKSLKKLFIDRKIPARQRLQIPVVADEEGILGVYGIGVHVNRREKPNLQIRFQEREKIKTEE